MYSLYFFYIRRLLCHHVEKLHLPRKHTNRIKTFSLGSSELPRRYCNACHLKWSLTLHALHDMNADSAPNLPISHVRGRHLRPPARATMTSSAGCSTPTPGCLTLRRQTCWRSSPSTGTTSSPSAPSGTTRSAWSTSCSVSDTFCRC